MIEQRSDAWFASRLGKVTASRIADVMAKTRSGYGASRANYMAQIICERLTQARTDTFTTAAMQWGTEKEPEAKAAYAFACDLEVQEAPFVDHPSIEMSGASPDGYVGDDGLTEIKAPNTSTHIDTLISQAIPNKYLLQMQWQMACTGRQWCDFVSYDPRMPPHLQMWVKRVERDDKLIAEVEAEVVKFLQEVNDKLAQLEAIK